MAAKFSYNTNSDKEIWVKEIPFAAKSRFLYLVKITSYNNNEPKVQICKCTTDEKGNKLFVKTGRFKQEHLHSIAEALKQAYDMITLWNKNNPK